MKDKIYFNFVVPNFPQSKFKQAIQVDTFFLNLNLTVTKVEKNLQMFNSFLITSFTSLRSALHHGAFL